MNKKLQQLHTSFPLVEVLVERRRILPPGEGDEVFRADAVEAESKLGFSDLARR